jgi:predicted enzyme related to lactoylglutathione lyase
MTEAFPRGRFIWYELMTSDPSTAQSFYTQLTGWTTKDGEIAD